MRRLPPRPFASLAILILLLPGCQPSPHPPTVQPAAADILQKSVYYFASPDLEGRGLGTAGLDNAAHYISGYFRGLALQPPPGQDSYFQTFTKTYISAPSPQSFLKLADAAYTPADFVPLAFSAEISFDAPVVFVGYGLTQRPQTSSATQPAPYDDYAGVNLTGKIALAMALEPHDEKGRSRLAFPRDLDARSKARLAAQHGAVALVIVHPPTHPTPDYLTPFRRYLESPQSPQTQRTAPLDIPLIHITQKTADDLLRRAGAKTLKTYAASINSSLSPRSFAVRNLRLQGQVAFARQTYTFRNIVACLPGRGQNANQYIVIGAHYDHIGFVTTQSPTSRPFSSLPSRPASQPNPTSSPSSPPTTAPTTRPYYPGADDNASGTAGLLELARLFSQASRPPRSILFVAFSGEEIGLFGSRYFVDNPPIPLSKIVAMVNLDMLGRLRDNTVTIGGTATAAAFPQILSAANANPPLQFKYAWTNGIAPSDNASFAIKQIPALFFITGGHSDLHRSTDTPDKINYLGHARVVDLVANTIRALTIEKNLSFTTAPPTTRPSTRPTTP